MRVLAGFVLMVAYGSHAAEFVAPNDNLIVEAIPPISKAVVDSVDRYNESRSASLTSWHPRHREMLIGTRFAETPQVHQVKFPGGARQQLTFASERVVGGTFDPREGSYMIFEKDAGGNEIYQLYRYDFATGNITLLTDGKSRHAARAWSPAWGMAYRNIWSRSGEQMAYIRLISTPEGLVSELRAMNPLKPSSDRLIKSTKGSGFVVVDWSIDDRALVILEFVSVSESYLWLVDVAHGEKTLLTPKGQKIFYGGGQLTKDNKSLLTVTDKDSEFHRLALIELSTGKHTYLTSHIPWDVEEFAMANDGKTIAFVTNENGISRLGLLDVASKREKRRPALGVGVIGDLAWHSNSRDLGFTITNAKSPSDVYSIDVKNYDLTRWTSSETGGLHTTNFSEPEIVQWKSFDGRMISGFLYRPQPRFKGPRPVIVQIHGGPESQFRPTFLGSNNYYLNELGVALLFPNIRGSMGYGKTFLTLDNGKNREDAYRDIGALLGWIADQKDLDSERVMVSGGSYGGHMTFVVASRYADQIRCARSVVGISNLRSFLENTESYRRDLRRAEYGDERDAQMREWMETNAPVNNAQKIKKPLFVVQGLNDPRVPQSEAVQIVQTLRKQGTPAWFLMAKDEGHGFSKKKNQDFLFYSTVLFAKEHLLN